MGSACKWIIALILATLSTTVWTRDNPDDGKISKDDGEANDYRLPGTIMPKSYKIMLELSKEEEMRIFDGTVLIDATITSKTDEVIFHAGNINVTSCRIVDRINKSLNIRAESYNSTTEMYKIVLDTILPMGKNITIAIKYRGTLREDMIGFYRSSYVDEHGDIKWLAATQFQTTHARHAFPCFDEPSFKATFTIHIQRPKNLHCLSNTPLLDSKEMYDGRVWDTFGTTVQMSTYLVAFVISDFSNLRNGNFSVWARSNAIDQAQWALNIGPRALQYFSNLFEVNYQLDKMDMVAVPDFAAGAMENWGLITYRETRMLYDDKESSISTQQDVASVIVHECAHMWMGNFVTPKWWNYLWLSEAFARYYQYEATSKLEPHWKMEQQFVVDQLQSVFGVDAIDTSSPMTKINISSQAEIGTTGDTITYAKGASVVRMMELTFGSKVFNSALREYLKKKKYSSAIPEDLWSALQDQIDGNGLKMIESVEKIMNTWTKQAGFPVLTVNVTKGSIKLRQERFYLRRPKSASTDVIWWIPITWTTGKDPNFDSTSPKHWFGERNGEISMGIQDDEWMVFNVREAGYYRVNYDRASWYRIIDTLKSDRLTEIHEINRAAIIDDMINLARAGLLDYETILTALNYIKKETNYLPFKAALRGLEYLHKRFANRTDYDYIKSHSMSLINNIYNNLGFVDRVDDTRFTILLRREINNWACNLDNQDCIEKSRFYFNEWRVNLTPVPKNQRTVVYCTSVKHGTSDDWDFLWEQYLKSNCASDQSVILNALGCSQNTTILEKFLLRAITNYESNRIRKQDSTTAFSAVYDSGIFGPQFILDFVRKHHVAMVEYYGNYDAIGTLLSGASRYFSTDGLVAKFAKLMDDFSKEFKDIEKSLRASLDLAKYELDWYDKNGDEIISWMKKNGREEISTTTMGTTIDDGVDPAVDTSNTTDYRLPTNLQPVSYSIRVKPYMEMEKFTFDGTVNITAIVAKSTNKIVLHWNEIVLRSVVPSVDGQHLKIMDIDDNKIYNFLTISLTENLTVNKTLKLEISYLGQLNKEMRGFYRSSYIDDSGVTRWLAATHLEPVGARKMFPCFDEPSLKATFTLSVSRPTEYNSISNTRLKSSVPDGDGRVLDTFEETPIMSTYLLALVVSDFKSLVDIDNNCATWARPNAIDQAKYALSVMSPLVKFYENHVGHPYQLSKLDMIALPDFASGAMENWGLLTYKESNMLYDERDSPITSKQSIADVISHEISHQWFGDQVSPRWWKYLWLSEGFARYFQYHGTANVETEWGLESQFVVEQLHSAFGTDALISTHPMTHEVYSPSEISSIFDTISYAKGASVLRMIEKTFGSKLFYDALHDYLEKRKWKDATSEHLYEAFQNQVITTGAKLETTIAKIMDTWTMQSGYPVVEVKITGADVNVLQKRFFLRNPDSSPEENIWWIPLTWATKSNPDFMSTKAKYWLSKKEDAIKLDSSNEWIIFNLQESGYYRVNYDPDSWYRIIDALMGKDFQIIHEVNRASIIDDLLAFGRAGHVDYKIVLSATQYLNKETNYIPWRAAFNGLDYLNKKFESQNHYELYRTHILTILNPIYEKLGFEESSTDSHYNKLLRRSVVNWACQFGIKSCIDQSLKYFAEWKSNESVRVPVNFRNTVYCIAMRYGTMDDWQFLWDKYLSTKVTTEKVVILSALGCSNDKTALETLLKNAINENSGIRLQDSSSAFSAVYSSSLFGAEFALDFIGQYYTDINQYYGSYSNIESYLSGISSRFTTKELVYKFEEFVKTFEEKLESISSSMRKSLEKAREELVWYNENSPKLFEWLDKTYSIEDYRLPTIIRPDRYDIYLRPNLDPKSFDFDGEITIVMNIREDTSKILLHANELTINNITVYENSVNNLEVSNYTINSTTHRFTIYLKKTVAAGSVISAYIIYKGKLNDEMNGFYRSSYVDQNGETRWLASTKFEPVYARKAFPCFDEPIFKAKFTINIERPNDYKTLSNMPKTVPIPSTTPNRTWDSYEQSVSMSSYLVAFVVSDFSSLTNKDGNFSVWGRPRAIEYGSYALEVGQKVLDFLERFTGIDYPIGKMDFVAVPDFLSGAMENWGLITFREYGLFENENVTSVSYKKYLNTVVAHELVHMWFGNLVTCKWWDYIWLQEGFAQYIQYIAGDYTEPKWNLLEQFVVYELQVAMSNDASPNIHAMNNNLTKPLEIADSFDKIAYAKSASVIRMMHHALGAKVFESGLRTYLERKKYGNANPDDLWSAIQFNEDLENPSGNLDASISVLMDNWTNKPGFPVINVTWESDVLTFVQQRFFLKRPEVDCSEFNGNYWIPISFTTRSEANFSDTRPIFWFGEENYSTELKLIPNEWFVINIQETGYYRVNYDGNSWRNLVNGLLADNFDGIHPINRAQIIDDLFNLARADYVEYDLVLWATKYLEREEHHLPWRAFFNAITFLNQRFDGHEIGEDFADHVLLLVRRIYEKVDFYDSRDEDQLHQLNRQLILTWSCKFGHSGCVELSKKYFNEWQKDENKWISPNARPAVYCTSIKNGNYEDWKFLWEQYEKTDFSSEKIVILNALGCSRNKTTLYNYLKFAMSEDNAIRDQDIAGVFSSVYNADRFGVDAMMGFLVDHYKEVRDYYGNWNGVANLFHAVAERISTTIQIEKLESIVNDATNDFNEIRESLRSAVKKAKQNLDWFDKHAPNIHVWLTKAPDSGGNTENPDGPNFSLIATSSFSIVFTILGLVFFLL